MNTNDETEKDRPYPDEKTRPLGYWLRVVDALVSREFADAFETEGVSRREWMLLNVVSGDVSMEEPRRNGDAREHHSRTPGMGRHSKGLRRLEERGWVARTEGGWTLTDEGRTAKERLSSLVDGIRTRVAGAVTPEDYTTTLATLGAIARELGGDEPWPLPHGHVGHGSREAGPGFGPRFGRRGRACGHGRPGHGHGHGPHRHGHPERAYERGFAAGFTAGASSQPGAA